MSPTSAFWWALTLATALWLTAGTHRRLRRDLREASAPGATAADAERHRDLWRLRWSITGILAVTVAVLLAVPAVLAGDLPRTGLSTALVSLLAVRLTVIALGLVELSARADVLSRRAQTPALERLATDAPCRCQGTRCRAP